MTLLSPSLDNCIFLKAAQENVNDIHAKPMHLTCRKENIWDIHANEDSVANQGQVY